MPVGMMTEGGRITQAHKFQNSLDQRASPEKEEMNKVSTCPFGLKVAQIDSGPL